ADARLRHALLVAGVEQFGGDGAHVADLEPAAVDAGALVARQAQVYAGERRHRARGAEHVRGAAAAAVVEATGLRERRELAEHGLARGGERGAVEEAAGETLDRGYHADRQPGRGGN